MTYYIYFEIVQPFVIVWFGARASNCFQAELNDGSKNPHWHTIVCFDLRLFRSSNFDYIIVRTFERNGTTTFDNVHTFFDCWLTFVYIISYFAYSSHRLIHTIEFDFWLIAHYRFLRIFIKKRAKVKNGR